MIAITGMASSSSSSSPSSSSEYITYSSAPNPPCRPFRVITPASSQHNSNNKRKRDLLDSGQQRGRYPEMNQFRVVVRQPLVAAAPGSSFGPTGKLKAKPVSLGLGTSWGVGFYGLGVCQWDVLGTALRVEVAAVVEEQADASHTPHVAHCWLHLALCWDSRCISRVALVSTLDQSYWTGTLALMLQTRATSARV